MASHSAVLTVKVLTDAKQAAAGADAAAGKFAKFGAGVKKLALPAAIAGAAIFAFGKKAVESASRTQQAMGAVDTVFGKSADKVKSWAANGAQSVGLAKSEYGELASTIGAMLKNTGVPLDQIAGKTKNLITTGADLAATYGGTTADAVEALGSALRGETDPIEKYGISIKQATIAAEQHRLGTDKLTGAAGAAAKTQALLSLVTKQAGPALGQFARESDSAAGSAQIAAAQWENAKSNLGTALLPIVSKVAGMFAKLASIMSGNVGVTQIVIGIIAGLVVGILALNAALSVYETVLAVVTIMQEATWAAALGPILLVIAAIALVVAAFVILYKKSATFRAFIDTVWAAVKQGAQDVVNLVRPLFAALFKIVTVYAKTWWAYLTFVFGAIKAAVKIVTAIFRGDWQGVLAGVRALVAAFAQFFRSIFNLLPGPVRTALSTIGSIIRTVFGTARAVVSTIVGAIKTTISTIASSVKTAFGGLSAILTAPFEAAQSAVQTLIGYVESLIGWISKIHIPDVGGILGHIPGLGKAAPATGPALGPVSRRGDPSALGLGARASTSTTAGGGPTIVVQGALDPEAVARQIKAILQGHDRRVGLTSRAP